MSPRVSVLTPVYNGAKYLADCIESVLAQDYSDYEYVIQNNCSTDGSLEIAHAYARKDRRIQVKTNPTFVSAIDNHNLAFGSVPRHHKYCKVVSADDWITPDCLGKMVALAEAHPGVGIVGCYQRSGKSVRWLGVPTDVSVMSGRDAGRLGLLNGIHVFGTPTSVLYRVDLLRMRDAFFPHKRSHADTSACYESFRHCKFGFLHEVLAVERVHPAQWSTKMDELAAGMVAYLDDFLRYGPQYLSASEFAARKDAVFIRYYRFLGGCALKLRGKEFWSFHSTRLRELGYPLDRRMVAKAAIKEAVEEGRNPLAAMQKVLAVLRSKIGQQSSSN